MNYSLDPFVQDRIEALCATKKPTAIREAAQRLITSYQNTSCARLVSEEDFLAYLIYRFPATYAVNAYVFEKIAQRMPDCIPTSLVDLGAGPGTATCAAKYHFPTLQSVTLIEQQQKFLDIAKQLIPEATGIRGKIEEGFPEADMMIASYTLSELNEKVFDQVVDKLYTQTKKLCVIIEPGSKRGFANILRARELLLARGAHIVAPCPHAQACPMAGNDWCHFSVRLQRTRFHTFVKEGTRGYEDEKFSYLVVSKEPVKQMAADRVVFPPMKKSGHIIFRVCGVEGKLNERIIAKRHGESYALAKKIDWGDSLLLATEKEL